MNLGKLILTGLALGAVGVVATRKTVEASPDGPNPGPYVPDEGALVEAYLGGGEPGQELPMIFLLHAEGSTPAAAIDVLAPVTGAAHIVAPTGRYTSASGRHFVNPSFAGPSYWIALRKELERLSGVLETVATTSPMPSPPRAMVIGLGAAGALAVGLGLQMPLRVRQAWGTGGAVPAAWVPLSAPLLMNMQRPQLRKLTFGDAIPVDNETAKLATARGFDLGLMQLNAPPSIDLVRKWMIEDVDVLLNTP